MINRINFRNLIEGATAAAAGTLACLGAVKWSGHIFAAIKLIETVSLPYLAGSIGGIVFGATILDFATRVSLEKIFKIRSHAFLHLSGTLVGLASTCGASFLLLMYSIVPLGIPVGTLLIGIGGVTFLIYKLLSTKHRAVLAKHRTEINPENVVAKTKALKEKIIENPFIFLQTTIAAFVGALIPEDEKSEADSIKDLLAPVGPVFNKQQVAKEFVRHVEDMDQSPLLSLILLSVLVSNQYPGQKLLELAKCYVKVELDNANNAHQPTAANARRPRNFISTWVNTRVESIFQQYRECRRNQNQGVLPKLKNTLASTVSDVNKTRGLWITTKAVRGLSLIWLGEMALRPFLYSSFFVGHKCGLIDNDNYNLLYKSVPAVSKLLVLIGPTLSEKHNWDNYINHMKEIDEIIKSPKLPDRTELTKKILKTVSDLVDEFITPEYLNAFDAAFKSIGTIVA